MPREGHFGAARGAAAFSQARKGLPGPGAREQRGQKEPGHNSPIPQGPHQLWGSTMSVSHLLSPATLPFPPSLAARVPNC